MWSNLVGRITGSASGLTLPSPVLAFRNGQISRAGPVCKESFRSRPANGQPATDLEQSLAKTLSGLRGLCEDSPLAASRHNTGIANLDDS